MRSRRGAQRSYQNDLTVLCENLYLKTKAEGKRPPQRGEREGGVRPRDKELLLKSILEGR